MDDALKRFCWAALGLAFVVAAGVAALLGDGVTIWDNARSGGYYPYSVYLVTATMSHPQMREVAPEVYTIDIWVDPQHEFQRDSGPVPPKWGMSPPFGGGTHLLRDGYWYDQPYTGSASSAAARNDVHHLH